ncbi:MULTISPECIES: hypothetical protein [unclassified Mesorhizobium]|uniref:hypothetical protein n=1 Tax=unclassified Mesorhizobium TaxID=325217 RepID=UPI00115DE062|nr:MULTISPECIES: hypothetical protein [unclassified Mesorhizobium]TRC80583.1 hypothetical protein FJV80_22195 [Mesorhizobium sp. WSM4310]
MSIAANIAGEGGSALPTGAVPGAVESVLRAERVFPGFAIPIRSDFEDRRGVIRTSPSRNRRKSHARQENTDAYR